MKSTIKNNERVITMEMKGSEEMDIKRTETIACDCKHRNCCHRGKAGHQECCDYMFHIGASRPTSISECGGFRRRVVMCSLSGRRLATFNNVIRASEETGVPRVIIGKNMRKEIKRVGDFVFIIEFFSKEEEKITPKKRVRNMFYENFPEEENLESKEIAVGF